LASLDTFILTLKQLSHVTIYINIGLTRYLHIYFENNCPMSYMQHLHKHWPHSILSYLLWEQLSYVIYATFTQTLASLDTFIFTLRTTVLCYMQHLQKHWPHSILSYLLWEQLSYVICNIYINIGLTRYFHIYFENNCPMLYATFT
jgi:hypothetical protein